jgi:hypothetical protein
VKTRWVVGGIALAVVALELAFAGRYGYHRDELYFVAAGRRLAWGYPDQPPLTPALARIATASLPGSVVWLRLLPALTAGAIIVLTALVAEELGGGRRARILAALSAAVATAYLAIHHLFGTTSLDLLFWAAALAVLARLFRTGDQRLWLAFGGIVGVGLLNKHLLLFLGLGLAVGLLLPEQRHHLRSRYLWLGALLALVLVAPNLAWQAANGWPGRDMAALLAREHGGPLDRLLLVPLQFLQNNPFTAPVWVAGLVWLLRHPPFRPLGVAYLAIIAALLVTAGQAYYPAGMYVALYAAGGVAVERWLARRPAGAYRQVVATLLISGVVALPIALPVLPPDVAEPVLAAVNPDALETVGWPELVDTVSQVYERLPQAERATAVILTQNYGQAGAIERWRDGLGLPQPISGHNGYGLWGPGDAPEGTTIAVGVPREQLDRLFGQVTLAATIDNDAGVANDEQGASVWLCRDQLRGWDEAWPDLVHLG